MKHFKNVVKKVLYMMSPEQKALSIFVLAATVVGSILECLGVSVIVPLINVLQDPEAIMKNSFFNQYSFWKDITYNQLIGIVGGGVVLLYIIKNLFFVFLSWIRIKFSCKIQREMSVKILKSYLNRGYQFFLEKNYGELNRGVTTDVNGIYNVLNALFKILSEIFTIILICVFMFVSDWQMAMAVMIMALFCLMLIYLFFRKKMYLMGIKERKYTSRAGQALVQAFQGAKDVLLFKKQEYFIKEYEKNQIEVQRARSSQVVGMESPAYLIEGVCVSGLMAVVCMRIIAVGNDPDFIAVLAAFAVGAFRILPSLGRISSSLNILTNALPSVDSLYREIRETEKYTMNSEQKNRNKLFGLINSEKQIERKVDFAMSDGKNFNDRIEVENVSFGYKEDMENVLENVSLTIKKGSSIALIGSSGSGKSTLVDIMLGLLIPQQGAVRMDGIKITEIPDKWAQTIGYVPQSVFLSAASIKENVAFGEEETDIDVERVWEALKRAELFEFVKSLPNGLETYVGDRGVQLSGGQRQRIAIARALYHRPEIMVLDEATSALDNDTEAAIMSAIDSLQGQVTLIIVAHRLSTVKNCDVIYEVKDKGICKREKDDVLKNA